MTMIQIINIKIKAQHCTLHRTAQTKLQRTTQTHKQKPITLHRHATKPQAHSKLFVLLIKLCAFCIALTHAHCTYLSQFQID